MSLFPAPVHSPALSPLAISQESLPASLFWSLQSHQTVFWVSLVARRVFWVRVQRGVWLDTSCLDLEEPLSLGGRRHQLGWRRESGVLDSESKCCHNLLGEPGPLSPQLGLHVRIRFLRWPFGFNTVDSKVSSGPNHHRLKDVYRIVVILWQGSQDPVTVPVAKPANPSTPCSAPFLETGLRLGKLS